MAEQVRGATSTFRQWFADNGARQRLRAVWRELFREFDAVICPVTPTAAFAHDFTPDQDARVIKVNGEPRAFESRMTVAALINALELDLRKVAVELNREIVPRSTYAQVALSTGDILEIVHFIGGG